MNGDQHMKRTIRTAAIFALASLCLCPSAGAAVVSIEIHGAQSVVPTAINDSGQVAGMYFTKANTWRGFLRQPDGTLTTFAIPGAFRTVPRGISATGVITGVYAINVYPGGFVRAVDGTLTIFQVPHGPYVEPFGVNPNGWSVGDFIRNTHSRRRPFLRDPSGAVTEFTIPHASGGTVAKAVNSSQTIAGETLLKGESYPRGFVRAADGAITLFGDPDIYVSGMNDDGTIAGALLLEKKAFVRTSDGTITAFVGPNGPVSTNPFAINNSGTIAGQFDAGDQTFHGFIRSADGTIAPFDVAGSVDTVITAINNNGVIAGHYYTEKGTDIGFVGTP